MDHLVVGWLASSLAYFNIAQFQFAGVSMKCWEARLAAIQSGSGHKKKKRSC